jgi:putative phosphoribosyl transferase
VRAILPEMDVQNRTVVVVGQGVASGAKMLGAVAAMRDRGARKVVVAAPAGSGEAAWQLNEAADLVVIPHRPARFKGIEQFYEDFTPVTDELVLAIIERWVKTRPQQQPGVKTLVMKVTNDQGILLSSEIDLPPGTARGSGPFPGVVFAHGFESDARNPRNVPISQRLAKRGLISVRPDFTGHGRSEGSLDDATAECMLEDLRCVVRNVRQLHEVDGERLGLVGSGSGAILALTLAREDPDIRAVVIRGPMCGDELKVAESVKAPTLLIYADQDPGFASVRDREHPLPSTHQTLEIPDSTRLFVDPISRELMFGATVDWLYDKLTPLPMGDLDESESGPGPGSETTLPAGTPADEA